jgi:hypothetical protein
MVATTLGPAPMPHSRRVIPAALVAAAIVSCGSSSQRTVACTPPPTLPPLPPANASAGPVSVVADREHVAQGGPVAFIVTITGPVHFTAACSAPVQLIVSDQAGIHVFADAPAAPQGVLCDMVTLAAGQKVQYSLIWHTDASLPSGGYLATFTAGDQPGVSEQVVVGQPPATTLSC